MGSPTVILAKTVKGYGMGEAGEGQNITHQQKKMGENVLRAFRDRFGVDLRTTRSPTVPFLRLEEGGPEQAYLSERRAALGGRLPARRRTSKALGGTGAVGVRRAAQGQRGPGDLDHDGVRADPDTRCCATSRSATGWCRSCPDESRTFGMEGMFRQFGIFSQVGQLYRPEDADQLMFYKEDKSGRMLQEGINEAGAMSSWIAAATSTASDDSR